MNGSPLQKGSCERLQTDDSKHDSNKMLAKVRSINALKKKIARMFAMIVQEMNTTIGKRGQISAN